MGLTTTWPRASEGHARPRRGCLVDAVHGSGPAIDITGEHAAAALADQVGQQSRDAAELAGLEAAPRRVEERDQRGAVAGLASVVAVHPGELVRRHHDVPDGEQTSVSGPRSRRGVCQPAEVDRALASQARPAAVVAPRTRAES
jgi:hypothetical protein